jgi:hypothetical protein
VVLELVTEILSMGAFVAGLVGTYGAGSADGPVSLASTTGTVRQDVAPPVEVVLSPQPPAVGSR